MITSCRACRIARFMSGDVCQNGSAILAQDCGPWVLGDERLQEMDAAMARLMTKGDEKVVVKEKAPPTGNIVPEVDPSQRGSGHGHRPRQDQDDPG